MSFGFDPLYPARRSRKFTTIWRSRAPAFVVSDQPKVGITDTLQTLDHSHPYVAACMHVDDTDIWRVRKSGGGEREEEGERDVAKWSDL